MGANTFLKLSMLWLCLEGSKVFPQHTDVRKDCTSFTRQTVASAGKEGDISKRIIGGEVSDTGQWPFLVSLKHAGQHTCGGTLIHPQFVLSALHCFESPNGISHVVMEPDGWKVVVGEHHIAKHEGHESEIEIAKLINPLAKPRTSYFEGDDIVLLKLARPVSFDHWAKPICLPLPNLPTPKPGTPCLATGWGLEDFNEGNLPLEPKHVSLPYFDRKLCDQVSDGILTDDMICAGGPSEEGGVQNTCSGDSGGPLLCETSMGTWTYFGISSLSNCDVNNSYPAVFTSVMDHLNWAETAMIVEMAQVK